MGKRVLQPNNLKVRGSYSPGWEVYGGRLIFASGQIPWNSEGQTVGKGDIEASFP